MKIKRDPPCLNGADRSLCGLMKWYQCCETCGHNPEENERRKALPLVPNAYGIRRKIIRRGK